MNLVAKWIIGLCAGTLIIAVTSPLFVRSYLPQQFDATRGTRVLSAHKHYRWRSEGYATTLIGEHGMPGRPNIGVVADNGFRIALWGDSQAEGVCVEDGKKLFAQMENAGDDQHKMTVLPFARSGDSARDWLHQFPHVESNVGVDGHAILICEISDLLSAANLPTQTAPANTNDFELVKYVPAFVIQSARNVLTDASGRHRRLRFGIGPIPRAQIDRVRAGPVDWTPIVTAIAQATEKPLFVIYAPKSPQIGFGKIDLIDEGYAEFKRFEQAAEAAGVIVIDVSDALGGSAKDGVWPHGFHNGRFGSGHLNEAGYQVIAQQAVPVIAEAMRP